MDVYNLKDMWGAIVFRGFIAILFGIAAVFWPGITLVTLVYLFSAYVIVTGLMNMIVGLTNWGGGGTFWSRILLTALGVLELGVGVYLLRHPLVSFGTLILLISLVLIVRALFEIFAGIFSDAAGSYKTILVISGILTGLAGVVLLFQPAEAGVAFVWILGLYALITGPMLIALGFEAKNSTVPVKVSRT